MINAEAGSQRDAEEIKNLLSEQALDAEAHRTLGGPGLLESLYEDALFYELFWFFLPLSNAETDSELKKSLRRRVSDNFSPIRDPNQFFEFSYMV